MTTSQSKASLEVPAVAAALGEAESLRRPGRLLRLPEVMHRTGLTRSTLYRRIAEGAFPKAYSLGGKIVAWAESDVDQWIAARLCR